MNKDFARQQMIEQQVRAWDVLDAEVLASLGKIERERFVPILQRDNLPRSISLSSQGAIGTVSAPSSSDVSQ